MYKKEIGEKLAKSLTAETTDLLPFLPYLLQDIWELGSSPADMVALIEKHLPVSGGIRVLDLACGKGAVSVRIAQKLGATVKGIDLIPEFIEYAERKAKELGVSSLCCFEKGDVNDAVLKERDYDCAVWGAAGNVLGDPETTLKKLKRTLRGEGCLLLDDAYVECDNRRIRYRNYEYLTHGQWLELFRKNRWKDLAALSNTNNLENESNNASIKARAGELIERYPEKQALFESYVQSQLDESHDLANNLVGVTWLLQKID